MFQLLTDYGRRRLKPTVVPSTNAEPSAIPFVVPSACTTDCAAALPVQPLRSTKMLIFVSATLSDATWQMSGLVILMTLIGGLGTLVGPVIGAFIVVLLENKVGDFGAMLTKWTGIEWFQRLGESVTIVIGLIFVICVLAFRRGLVGELSAWWQKRQST
jgi:hypothetical protein